MHQVFAVDRKHLGIGRWHHALVIGKLALDQLRNQLDVAKAELRLVGRHLHAHGVVGVG